MRLNFVLLLLMGTLSASVAFADSPSQKKGTNCPASFNADQEFGVGTTENTTCITKRDHIKVVLNMSTGVLNPKSGVSQTLSNALSMSANYKAVYGIQIGKGAQMNIVAHFDGGQFLLNDAAYNKAAGVTTGNPSRKAVQTLLERGIHFYMCQVTMRGSGWTSADLLPGVKQVPSGVLAVADYALRGWAVITP